MLMDTLSLVGVGASLEMSNRPAGPAPFQVLIQRADVVRAHARISCKFHIATRYVFFNGEMPPGNRDVEILHYMKIEKHQTTLCVTNDPRPPSEGCVSPSVSVSPSFSLSISLSLSHSLSHSPSVSPSACLFPTCSLNKHQSGWSCEHLPISPSVPLPPSFPHSCPDPRCHPAVIHDPGVCV